MEIDVTHHLLSQDSNRVVCGVNAVRVTHLSQTAMAMARLVQFLCLFYCASMECRREQRATIKACVSWRFDPTHTYNSLHAVWGDHTLSKTQVRHWFRVFSDDPTRGTSDKKRPGRPRTCRSAAGVTAVDHALETERRTSSRSLAAQVNMSHTSVLKVLRKDLNMRKIAPRFVPRRLTHELLQERLEMSRRNLARINEDHEILKKIVATDETWCYTYDPRSKKADMQWAHHDEPRPSKPLRSRSQKKLLLILFFDAGGVISFDFVEGTVNSEVYINALRNMREAYRCKRPALWYTRDFHLLQDNATPHTSDDTSDYLLSVQQSVWEHPRYSPDLSPCDYWAFPALKDKIKGHVFNNLDDLQTAVSRELRHLHPMDFVKCFNNLAHWYEECVQARGHYFEGKGQCPCLAAPE